MVRQAVTTVQEKVTLIKTLRVDGGVADDAQLLLVNNREAITRSRVRERAGRGRRDLRRVAVQFYRRGSGGCEGNITEHQCLAGEAAIGVGRDLFEHIAFDGRGN
jgi:hypothetical protein